MTTAIDINTNENISIKPIAIYQSDAFDVLLLADANTGKGIWRGFDYQWYTDPEDGDLDHDADKIEDVYGRRRRRMGGRGKREACGIWF